MKDPGINFSTSYIHDLSISKFNTPLDFWQILDNKGVRKDQGQPPANHTMHELY